MLYRAMRAFYLGCYVRVSRLKIDIVIGAPRPHPQRTADTLGTYLGMDRVVLPGERRVRAKELGTLQNQTVGLVLTVYPR